MPCFSPLYPLRYVSVCRIYEEFLHLRGATFSRWDILHYNRKKGHTLCQKYGKRIKMQSSTIFICLEANKCTKTQKRGMNLNLFIILDLISGKHVDTQFFTFSDRFVKAHKEALLAAKSGSGSYTTLKWSIFILICLVISMTLYYFKLQAAHWLFSWVITSNSLPHVLPT